MVEGDNLIVNAGPPKGYQNTGEVSNKGIELEINAEPAKNLRLSGTYSYVNMKNPVYATLEHHFFFNAHYRLKKLHLIFSYCHSTILHFYACFCMIFKIQKIT